MVAQTTQNTLMQHCEDDKEEDGDEQKEDFRRVILHKPDGREDNEQTEDELGYGKEIVAPPVPHR